MPSPMPGARKKPSPSGPQCTMVSVMRRRRSRFGVAPRGAMPQIPHTNGIYGACAAARRRLRSCIAIWLRTKRSGLSSAPSVQKP